MVFNPARIPTGVGLGTTSSGLQCTHSLLLEACLPFVSSPLLSPPDCLEASLRLRHSKVAPPWTPLRNARRLGPSAHDGSRELKLAASAPIGAYPRRRPFRRAASQENKCRFAA